MCPIKLSITAFGPFIKTEVIDFKALGENPLFLINGATGSGKTTILDAICFALYGQTTGNEREAMQMRCDFAPDDLLTEVEFIFELAGKHYRILRLPEQTRNKSKGEGTTKQNASAKLSCLGSSDSIDNSGNLGESRKSNEVLLVARKVSDATKAIEEITGLKVDQFRQVMVLPQGKFRKLLMAGSSEREAIFSQLFETHIYKRIEDKLKAQSQVVSKKIDELKDNQQGVLQSVSLENTNELDKAINKLKPDVDSIKTKLELKEASYLNAVKTIEVTKELEQRFINLKTQVGRAAQLKLQEKVFDEKKQQLHLSNVAEKITPDFKSLSRIKQKFEESSKQLILFEELFQSAKKNLEEADLEFSKNPQRLLERDELKQNQVTLQSYQVKGKVLDLEHNNLKRITIEFEKIEREYKQVQSALDESLKYQEKSENERQVLESELSKRSDVKLDLKILDGQLEKRHSYEVLQLKILNHSKEFEAIKIRGISLKSDFEQKETHSKKLEFKWHKAQANILAKELKEQQACPVCGSLEHPKPAKSQGGFPTEEERDQAQQAVTILNEKIIKAREEYSYLKIRIKELNKQHFDLCKQWNEIESTSLKKLEKDKEQLFLQIRQYETEQKQLQALQEKLLKLRLEQVQARDSLSQIQTQQSDINAKRHVSKELVNNAEKELPEEYRELPKLEKAVTESNADIENLDSIIKQVQDKKTQESSAITKAETHLKTHQSTLNELKTELEEAQLAWQEALTKSGFEDEASYKKSHCDEESIASMEASIDKYDTEFQQITHVIEHQKALLQGKSEPNVVLLETQLEQIRIEKQIQDEHFKKKSIELSHLETAHATLKSISEKQQLKEDEYKIIGTLSHVANGQTGDRISFQRFVLSNLLDNVLIAASDRLTIMSKGRYLLLRKEERSKGNKASGLELEIEDSWTGKVRPASTLSGGESFLASLSLALGLSDVVQAYAGGIHLDTLFIDEGFGSLDADSLDLAIRTLTDLRDTGRMVGIISHVSDLKEQIPLRLDVKTGDYGSHIALVN